MQNSTKFFLRGIPQVLPYLALCRMFKASVKYPG